MYSGPNFSCSLIFHLINLINLTISRNNFLFLDPATRQFTSSVITCDLASRKAPFKPRPGHWVLIESFRCFPQSLHAKSMVQFEISLQQASLHILFNSLLNNRHTIPRHIIWSTDKTLVLVNRNNLYQPCEICPLKGWNSSNIWEQPFVSIYYSGRTKSRLKSRNSCYHSVQNLLSSSLLSKNLKIKMYRTVILPVVLYGCGTWSLILKEEHRLRVFENGVLRWIFGPKGARKQGSGENYIMRSLMICTPHQVLFGC